MKKPHSICIFLGAVFVLSGAANATTVLGQLALNGARIDGAPAPTGTTLISPSRLQTGDEASVVHLSTGGRLYLGPHSGAELETTETGEISVSANAGLVQLSGSRGEVMILAYNALATIDQEGEVQTNPEQRVCVLVSSGNKSSGDCAADHGLKACEWEESTSGELEEGDVYFVPADDEEECEADKGIAAWVWGAGGAAAAVVLADELESDDDDDSVVPVSPFHP